MMRVLVSPFVLLVMPGISFAQISGNIGYSESGVKARAEKEEQGKQVLTKHELPPTSTSTFVDANILMNVKADEYVAIFALAQEGATVAECGKKMEAVLKTFAEGLQPLGIGGANRHIDFVAQNKIYGFEVTGDVAREKLVGFELKKNVAIRFQDANLLDKLLAAAAKAEIYDLIKVDYVVKDAAKVQNKLMEEAARVIKLKSSRYEKLLGIKLLPPAQIYAERHATHYPTQQYDSYVAQETEHVDVPFRRDRFTIQGARKSRTFFYNGLDGDGFDDVIDPVIVEPVVQFTLYLKLKYEVEQIKAK
jgi:uncharacterized protein YggE